MLSGETPEIVPVHLLPRAPAERGGFQRVIKSEVFFVSLQK